MASSLFRPFKAFALAMLFLCAFSAAEFSPQLVSYARYGIITTQTVAAIGGDMSSLNITQSLPDGITGYEFPDNSVLVNDSWGNSFLQIYSERPGGQFRYYINTTVDSYRTSVKSLPSSYSPPSGSESYLGSDSLVQAGSQRIKSIAKSITENSSGKFESVALLAIWVHNEIDYDATLAGREVSATDILDNPRGVCTEYTTLFVSLSRSIGIPARYVNGYAYADKYGAWMGHSWAEVYLGGWVGVDPTWLEVGDIDATHIASVRKPSLGFATSAVSAMVYPPSAHLEFDKPSTDGVVANNIIMTDNITDTPSSTYSYGASSARLPAGGRFIAWVKQSDGEYRVVPVSLLPCKGEYSLVSLSGQDEYSIQTPGDTDYLAWEGVVSDSLPSGYRFTCPVAINSPYLSFASIPLNISTADSMQWPTLFASLSDSTPSSDENSVAVVRHAREFEGHKVSLLTKSALYTQTMKSSDLSFMFPAGAQGEQTVWAFSDIGDPVRLDYEVSAPSGASISTSGFGSDAFSNDANTLEFAINLSRNFSGEGQIEADFGGQSVLSEPFGLSNPTLNISVPFTPTVAGDALLSASLLSNGAKIASTSSVISVAPPPKAELLKVLSSPSEGGKLKATFLVSGSDGLDSLTLSANGQSAPVDGQSATLLLSPGDYDGELSWHTATGVHRANFSFSLSAPEPASIPDLSSLANIANSPKSESSGGTPSSSMQGTIPAFPLEYLVVPLVLILVILLLSFITNRKKRPILPPEQSYT